MSRGLGRQSDKPDLAKVMELARIGHKWAGKVRHIHITDPHAASVLASAILSIHHDLESAYKELSQIAGEERMEGVTLDTI